MNKTPKERFEIIEKELSEHSREGLNLDMSRGKPPPEVLSLSNGLFTALDGVKDGFKAENGFDCRNYGIVDGIPEAKRLLAPILDISESELILGGNSSLSMIYDTIVRAILFGVNDDSEPWGSRTNGNKPICFLCPAPGYDRHFAMLEDLGIKMITVPMNGDGPDMEMVESYVENDDTIKGLICVPMYSNPMGITFSDDVVKRLAKMYTKASDFRIFWDCAYNIHHLNHLESELHNNNHILNLLEECKKANNPDRVYMFSSTSKVTFPGSGIAIMGTSENNVAFAKKHISNRTIGPDKLNQLRHVKFFEDFDGIVNHMRKIAQILEPKFRIVENKLADYLGNNIRGEYGTWHRPDGGYFISFNGNENTAKRTVELCKAEGVTLTPAGATFPYGKDPLDRNIRIAPTYPSDEELHRAMEVFVLSVRKVNLEMYGI